MYTPLQRCSETRRDTKCVKACDLLRITDVLGVYLPNQILNQVGLKHFKL